MSRRSETTLYFLACVVLYGIVDYFFNQALLYFIGGTIGTLLKPLWRGKVEVLLVFLVWSLLLVGFARQSVTAHRAGVRYTAVLVIAALLSEVDLMMVVLLPGGSLRHFYIALVAGVLVKSLALSWLLLSGRMRYQKMHPAR
ncbi:hypothetical protein [Hymenobacter terrestris]|uniref:Rod shape-determining protein MreD n=1 Tax=Hymenobacter terrestris TaxID=2748310 RepID=A0ABX2QAT7_9BACT|nr:hypothetical protein [Hymenobacter terrestris]NVO86832.1 hypothetical protein [Hymenobacter terrestris]